MPNKTKQIQPSKSIRAYLNETLELQKHGKLGKKTFDGSTISQKELEELTRTLELRIRNNREAKVRAIDNLFESLANLVYFFEFIGLNRELIDVFEDDLHDILGLKSGGGTRNPKGEGIIRLLDSILSGTGLDTSVDVRFNHRRRMLKVMQHLVNQKARALVMSSNNDPLRYDDIQFRNMITADLDRAQVWANYLDRLTTFETKKPGRVLGLS